MFNDKNPAYSRQLDETIAELPGIATLRHRPQVSNLVVGRDLVELIQRIRIVPTLFFIDPWGYKGLSLSLLGTAIEGWGCDCIFFFNYNRINPALGNQLVTQHMNDLFGIERANSLRERVIGLLPLERQAMIISELISALKEVGGKHVLPFEFKRGNGERTSHYVIFVSKAFRGSDIMRDVMSKLSSDVGDVRNFRLSLRICLNFDCSLIWITCIAFML